MISGLGIHVEALLAAGYAVLLVLTAFALERFGRWSAGQARRSRSGDPEDRPGWECPTGEHPRSESAAYTCRPLHEYQGEPVGAVETWPHAEVVRFHDVLALVLIGLAGVVAAIGLVRHPRGTEIVLQGIVLGLVGLAGWRRLRELWNSPVEIPGVTRPLPRDENLPS